jgi:hypothetical protein
MKQSVRTLAGVFCVTLALACQKTEVPQPAPPPPPPEVAKPAEPPPAEPKRLKWEAGMVPTAAESEFAFSLGKMLFEQALFDEAEEQLRIAAAGGKSEADKLLLRARAELQAKEKLTAARRALDGADFATAERELEAIPGESVLRSMADNLAEQLERARQKRDLEFEEKVKAAVQDTFDEEGLGAADEAGETDEEEGKKPVSDGGIEIISGKPTHQTPDPDELPPEPPSADEHD